MHDPQSAAPFTHLPIQNLIVPSPLFLRDLLLQISILGHLCAQPSLFLARRFSCSSEFILDALQLSVLLLSKAFLVLDMVVLVEVQLELGVTKGAHWGNETYQVLLFRLSGSRRDGRLV